MPHVVVRSPEHSRARSLGWLAIAWMEHFCLHGPGDIQGRPLSYRRGGDAIPLSDELTKLTVDCYALDREGHRLYDSVFFSRPKGADKSGHASRIALFEALGPCRFAGWARGGEVFEWLDFRYEYQAGDPMGRRVTYPFVRILATEEGQTGNVYDAIHFNCSEEDSPLHQAFARKDDVGLTRIFLPGGGEVRPSTASSSAKDGGKETFCNFDETHLYNLPELRRMYDTVRRNMTKRKDASPWSFETSTMYQPGQDSVAERSHALAEAIRQDKVRVRPHYFFDHREAPPIELTIDAFEKGITTEEIIREAMAEAYGSDWEWQDQERKLREVMDVRNEVADTLRYTLNQATSAHDAWVTPQQYDARVVKGVVIEDGKPIALGLDGSESDDHTVLRAADIETGYQWTIGIWDPSRHTDGKVPKAAVDKAVRDAHEKWDVVAFYSDVHPFEDYIDRWEQDFGDQYCARVTQMHPVKFDMRQQTSATKMIEALHTAVIDGVDISFEDDRRIRQYYINARRYPNSQGVTVAKGKKDEKIDAVPADGLARKARQDYLALPEDKKRKAEQQAGVFFV